MQIELVSFRPIPADAVERVSVEFERDDRLLRLRFEAHGDPDRIVWPRTMKPGRVAGLWRSTCFEAFVLTNSSYSEYNLSPSTAWASYRFNAYRSGMADAEETAAVLGLDLAPSYAALEATIELPSAGERLGLSAVVEAIDGSFSYWALAHPSDKPDFHHPDSFILDLP